MSAQRIRESLGKGTPKGRCNMQFAELLEQYTQRGITRGLEPASIRMHRYVRKSFLEPALGAKDVADLTVSDFDTLYLKLAERVHPSTIRKVHSVAGAALRMAERLDLVPRNVARLAELPKNRKPIRNVPTPEELVRFLLAARLKDRTIHHYALVMAGTAMRPGEACGLMKSDLDSSNVLTIERAVDVCEGYARIKSTKTGEPRRISVDSRIAAIIRMRRGPYVFGGKDPARRDLLSKRWLSVARSVDLSFTPRSMRHFHLTHLIASGVDLKTTATRAGHADPSITGSVYAQAVPVKDIECAGVVLDVLKAVGHS